VAGSARKLGQGRDRKDFNSILRPKPDACSNCIMGCHRRVTVSGGKYAMDSYGPEYETLGMVGSDCLIDNLLVSKQGITSFVIVRQYRYD